MSTTPKSINVPDLSEYPDMPITVAFDAVADRGIEVVATCKYGDVADVIAKHLAKTYPMAVLVIRPDVTQPIRRYSMEVVEARDVVESRISRSDNPLHQ